MVGLRRGVFSKHMWFFCRVFLSTVNGYVVMEEHAHHVELNQMRIRLKEHLVAQIWYVKM